MKHIRKFNESKSKSITYMLLSQSKEELEEAYFYLEPYDGRDEFVKIHLDESEEDFFTSIVLSNDINDRLENHLNDHYFKIGKFAFYSNPDLKSEKVKISKR